MRLFVAITLSEELKASALGTMHELKQAGVRGSYVPAANLHLTVCFIGETKERAKIEQALKTVKYKPFRLSAVSLGSFGDLLYLGAKGGQGISGLASGVRSALDAAGIPYDRQKFIPHITLIRKTQGQLPKLAVPKADMMVKKVSLMKSEQVNGRQIYTELLSF